MYCGSKAFLSDEDFKGNEELRKKLLQYYKAEARKKENDYNDDKIWSNEEHAEYTLGNGDPLVIEYMMKSENDGYVCYLARESVVYVCCS